MPDPTAKTTVDRSASVSPAAVLGSGVTVGPFAVIEAGAVVGDGTQVLAHAVVTRHATIGRRCQVHFGAVVGGDPQDLSFKGGDTRVAVGDETVVREHATIHRATKPGAATTVGRGCYLMGGSHVAHDGVLADRVILCNSALLAGHVQVGERAFLSGNTVVHQFARVGRLVMLSGTAGIGRDVGPFLTVAGRSVVSGLNAVGMRRAGYTAEARARVRDAYRLLFSAPTLEEGLALVRSIGAGRAEIQEILDFYQGSRRGYSRPAPGQWAANAQMLASSPGADEAL